jgi:hypothetical protein
MEVGSGARVCIHLKTGQERLRGRMRGMRKEEEERETVIGVWRLPSGYTVKVAV